MSKSKKQNTSNKTNQQTKSLESTKSVKSVKSIKSTQSIKSNRLNDLNRLNQLNKLSDKDNINKDNINKEENHLKNIETIKNNQRLLNLENLQNAQLPENAIEVGRIAEAWGIKGGFKVFAYSSEPNALLSAKKWFLEPAEKGEKHFLNTKLLSIQKASIHSDSIVAQSPDILDRDTAEILKNARIFIARENFPKTQSDEYYWVDLIGLNVVNRENKNLGSVTELISTGAQTVLVLTDHKMIPFVSVYIDRVDFENKTIFVDWQEDY